MSNEPVQQVERYQAMISQHPDVQTFKKFFQKEGTTWDFSEVAATQPARSKTRKPGLGRCLLNTGLGQCFVLFIFTYISKGQFHGKKTPKNGQGKNVFR